MDRSPGDWLHNSASSNSAPIYDSFDRWIGKYMCVIFLLYPTQKHFAILHQGRIKSGRGGGGGGQN